jgi:hypothetical protein
MPNSATNTSPTSYLAHTDVEAMRLSWDANRSIRVIRGKSAGWPGRPVIGLRYDGLYRITDEEQLLNPQGGLYMRFRLERLPGQGALEGVRSRPTAGEVRQEELVKLGYSTRQHDV